MIVHAIDDETAILQKGIKGPNSIKRGVMKGVLRLNTGWVGWTIPF